MSFWIRPDSSRSVSCASAEGSWDIVERPIRELGPNEVLIRVHASGICSSDHFVKEGTWPGLTYPRIPGHEVVGRIAELGSAIKERNGDGRFKIGALVGAGWNGGYCNRCDFCRKGEYWTCTQGGVTGFTFDGGHAEYMYADETGMFLVSRSRSCLDAYQMGTSVVVSLPEEALQNASYAELAPLFCAGTTVFDAIRTTNWTPGDICVVQGVGGLGHLAVQVLCPIQTLTDGSNSHFHVCSTLQNWV